MCVSKLLKNAILLQLFVGFSHAAIITVDGSDGAVIDDGNCTISEAILAANDDAVVDACAAGSGADTIEFSNDISLDTVYEVTATFGATGTPTITTAITLNGNGFILERNTTANPFRLIRTSSSAVVTIDNIQLLNGHATGSNSAGFGGAIFNQSQLEIRNSILKQNNANRGGALFHAYTAATNQANISNTLFNQNNGSSRGSDIYINAAVINTIDNSTFSESGDLTSIYISGGNINTLNNVTFSTTGGQSIVMDESRIIAINNSTFIGSTTAINSLLSSTSNDYSTVANLNNNIFQNTSACSTVYITNTNNNLADAIATCEGTTVGNTGIATNLSTTLSDNGCTSPLADGGCLPTHSISADSNAVNATSSNATSEDARGFSAVGARDIGAYEYRPIEACPLDLQIDGFSTTVSDADDLIQAIECANLNGEANGGDTIALGSDITLTHEYENDTSYGRTGTPPITSKIYLQGMGFSLMRDNLLGCILDGINDPVEFRLLRVTNEGNLDLNHITLSNGCVDSSFNPLSRFGGAIYNTGQLSIDKTVFSSNTASESGGGIMNDGIIFSIRNSVFSANSALIGGGLGNSVTINAIQNTTFSGNSATTNGGGIFNNGNINSIQNCTFLGNFATGSGTAINNVVGSITNINNTLFNNNSSISECSNSFGTIIGSNNLTNNLSGGCPGLLPKALTSATVGALADNGGPTMTHALLPTSEALDAGDVNSTTTDQRGFVASGIRDIGAFEAQPPVVTAPPDITVEATGPLTSPSLGMAAVVDVDEMGITPTASQSSDFTLGVTVVTWTATDSQGFTATDTQTVTIVDTTPPNVNAPADITMEATGPLTVVGIGNATAIDTVDGSLIATSDAPANYPLGDTTVTWSATDSKGNTGIDTQIITVIDTTAPEITIDGGNGGILNLNVGDVFEQPDALANDLVDGDIVSITVTGTVDTSVPGSYVITYTVTDNQGNTATANFTVIVSGAGVPPTPVPAGDWLNWMLLIALFMLVANKLIIRKT